MPGLWQSYAGINRRHAYLGVALLMAVTAAASVGPRFSVWRTLTDSFRVFGVNFVTFALVALCTHLIWPLAPAVPHPQPGAATLSDLASDILRTLLGLLVTCLTQAALAFKTVRTLFGHRSSATDIWLGLRLIVPVLVAGTITYAPIFVGSISEWGLGAYPIARGLVAVSLLPIMMYLILNFWLTTPVIVLEQSNALNALKRSRHLTQGSRWRILGLWIVIGIMMVFVAVIVAFATGKGLVALAASKPTTIPGAVWYVMVAIWGAFFATLTNVAYCHLRAEKEGAAERTAQDA